MLQPQHHRRVRHNDHQYYEIRQQILVSTDYSISNVHTVDFGIGTTNQNDDDGNGGGDGTGGDAKDDSFVINNTNDAASNDDDGTKDDIRSTIVVKEFNETASSTALGRAGSATDLTTTSTSRHDIFTLLLLTMVTLLLNRHGTTIR